MMSLNSPYSAVDPLSGSACLLQTPSIILLSCIQPQITQITPPAIHVIHM